MEDSQATSLRSSPRLDLKADKTLISFSKFVIFNLIHAGEMPPESESRPDAAQLAKALGSLRKDLRETNLAVQRKQGRVPARRLTRLEYGHTIRDLLSIGGDVTNNLPAENDSGSFDTVGSTQRISAVHMEGYLKAADEALDNACNLFVTLLNNMGIETESFGQSTGELGW